MTESRATIVFVHGLWLTGFESAWLRRELKHRMDADTVTFNYQSVMRGMAENAAELGEFLSAIAAPRVHLIGHSLGGLVILKYFAILAMSPPAGAAESSSLPGARPPLPPGRIVLMGSPLRGSQIAQGLAQYPLARMILGRGIQEEVLTPIERKWNGERELGIIAGDLSFGLGRWVGHLAAPNDGTVLVEETQLDGATDHIVLPVSHTGMQFSNAVAAQCAAFLSDGRFAHRD